MKKKIIIAVVLLALLLLLAASRKPTIWKADCVGCGDCVNICPMGAITLQNGKAVIDQNKCIDCKLCVTGCKYNAIRQYHEKKNILDFSDYNPLYFSNCCL